MTTAPTQHAYPEAERLDLVQDLHGHRVVDPYRWLEDADARSVALGVDRLAFLARHTGLELE
ncbi:MAG: hypothetical protein ACRDRH_17760 [Pseudonocardia sp.]